MKIQLFFLEVGLTSVSNFYFKIDKVYLLRVEKCIIEFIIYNFSVDFHEKNNLKFNKIKLLHFEDISFNY